MWELLRNLQSSTRLLVSVTYHVTTLVWVKKRGNYFRNSTATLGSESGGVIKNVHGH
jgi:hypothetical protein